MYRIHFWILSVWIALFAFSSHSMNFNKTAISVCSKVVEGCLTNVTDSIANAAINGTGEQELFGCAQAHTACLLENAFMKPTKTQACFVADAAWENLDIAIVYSVAIFFFGAILWPAILKGSAKGITKMANCDEEKHPYVKKVGKTLAFFTDENGDGVVTASELVSPQVISLFLSVTAWILKWYEANSAQALCDFSNTQN